MVMLLCWTGLRISDAATFDVADLIGDTEEVVLKHYARWAPERQERLTNILREKLSTAPRPNLVLVGFDGAGVL